MCVEVIRYPLKTDHLGEVTDDLLTIYDTVSVQRSDGCYVLKLQGKEKVK